MIFLELILENFGPYRGKQIIKLTPIPDHPIILFGGMNGGGKTTLMDAIRLALYGHRSQCSSRGSLSYSDFLTQCVNRHIKESNNIKISSEETSVELAFEYIFNNNPVEYRLKRKWTKNPKSGKDTLGILIDGWPDKTLVETWDDWIEQILPIGISNLFLFDGEQVKELAETSQIPLSVIEAISTLLGLEIPKKLSEDLDILATRKRKTLSESTLGLKLEDIEKKLNQQKATYTQAQETLVEKQKNLKKAQNNQKQAFNKFISEGGKIAAERNQLDRQLQELTKSSNHQREQLITLASDALPLSIITPLLQQAKIQAEKENQAQQAKIALELLEKRDRALFDYLTQIKTKPDSINQIASFLSEYNQQLQQQVKDQIIYLHTTPENITQLESLINHQLPNQLKQIKSIISSLQEQETDIVSTEQKIATSAPPEIYSLLEAALQDSREQLSIAEKEYEIAQKNLESINKEIEKTKQYLSEYTENELNLKNTKHILASISKVQKTLQLYTQHLTLRKLNELESVITECFLYLLHKNDLVHKVTIDIQTFNISLYDHHGQPVPKHRLSAGEKQLLAIALLWGLARVSNRNLPIAIDTPLGRLDSSHRQNLIERYFPSASHQVILLSTDTEINQTEVNLLRELDVISYEYLLKYDPNQHQTTIETGYFY